MTPRAEYYRFSPLPRGSCGIGRVTEHAIEVKGAYRNGKTPTTEGVHEGDSDGGVQKREPVNPGTVGAEQAGAVERVRPGALREGNEGEGSEREILDQ